MLTHLFDAELVHRSEMEPLTRKRPGSPMNPARRSRRRKVRASAGRHGGSLRPSDEASRIWTVAATLRFESDHQRYSWLDNALGVWEGEFDADAYRARYHAYVVKDDASEVVR